MSELLATRARSGGQMCDPQSDRTWGIHSTSKDLGYRCSPFCIIHSEIYFAILHLLYNMCNSWLINIIFLGNECLDIIFHRYGCRHFCMHCSANAPAVLERFLYNYNLTVTVFLRSRYIFLIS